MKKLTWLAFSSGWMWTLNTTLKGLKNFFAALHSMEYFRMMILTRSFCRDRLVSVTIWKISELGYCFFLTWQIYSTVNLRPSWRQRSVSRIEKYLRTISIQSPRCQAIAILQLMMLVTKSLRIRWAWSSVFKYLWKCLTITMMKNSPGVPSLCPLSYQIEEKMGECRPGDHLCALVKITSWDRRRTKFIVNNGYLSILALTKASN